MMTIFLPIILLCGYFTGNAPAAIKYAPELCGMAASAFIVVRASRYGFANIRLIYWVLMILIAIELLFGVIANQVQPGTVIIGGRMYLRTIPFFLLPLVLTPSEQTLRHHFYIVLAIALLQLPVATYQKVSNYNRALTEGYVTTTGDWVVGTFGISSYLSIFLICFSALIVALYARKIINARWTLVIVLLVLAPTMINETKATFFMAPLAIAVTMLAAAGKHKVGHSIKALVLMAGFVAVFIPVYDYFVMPRWGYGLIDFFMMEGRVEGYLDKGAEVGTTDKTGRIDSMRVAYDVLKKDPSTLAFGLGIGSITESNFGPQFEGKYYSQYGIFGAPTYARLFWEIGFLGALLVLVLILVAFQDACRLFKAKSAYGILAHSYLAIIPLMIISMMYKNLLQAPAIGACFWYYCGVVVAAARLPADVDEVFAAAPRPARPKDFAASAGIPATSRNVPVATRKADAGAHERPAWPT